MKVWSLCNSNKDKTSTSLTLDNMTNTLDLISSEKKEDQILKRVKQSNGFLVWVRFPCYPTGTGLTFEWCYFSRTDL